MLSVCPGPVSVVMPGDEIHVWQVSLMQQATHYEQFVDAMFPDERARASRFHFARDRRRFVVGRGLLREIVGLYLDLRPDQVRFDYGQQGKPRLADGMGDGSLQFNLAHSHELALVALVRNRAIGVDLEQVRDLPDADQLASQFFSKHEYAALQALPAEQRLVGFFNCWTRKEAYVKATGDGLNCPLGEFDVSLAPGEPARLLRVRGNPGAACRWSMWSLAPGPGYIGALALALPEADREHYSVRMYG
jgi:4'-phosphopantetheinyl transferase